MRDLTVQPSFEIDLTTEPIDLLLNAGAELNAKNAWGDTAVHYAPISGSYSSLEYLVEIGIQIGKDEKCFEKVKAISQSYNFSKVKKGVFRLTLYI